MAEMECATRITSPNQRPALLKQLCARQQVAAFDVANDRVVITDSSDEFVARRWLAPSATEFRNVFHVNIASGVTGDVALFTLSAETGEITHKRTMSRSEFEYRGEVLRRLRDGDDDGLEPPKFPELPPPTDELLDKVLSSPRTRVV